MKKSRIFHQYTQILFKFPVEMETSFLYVEMMKNKIKKRIDKKKNRKKKLKYKKMRRKDVKESKRKETRGRKFDEQIELIEMPKILVRN